MLLKLSVQLRFLCLFSDKPPEWEINRDKQNSFKSNIPLCLSTWRFVPTFPPVAFLHYVQKSDSCAPRPLLCTPSSASALFTEGTDKWEEQQATVWVGWIDHHGAPWRLPQHCSHQYTRGESPFSLTSTLDVKDWGWHHSHDLSQGAGLPRVHIENDYNSKRVQRTIASNWKLNSASIAATWISSFARLL